MKATLFLKMANGEIPYRTCYFDKKEYQRLMKDFDSFQKTGVPKEGVYKENLDTGEKYFVRVAFDSISRIKAAELSD